MVDSHKGYQENKDLFGNLGVEIQISKEVLVRSEKFVCKMYGEKGVADVNRARSAFAGRN